MGWKERRVVFMMSIYHNTSMEEVVTIQKEKGSNRKQKQKQKQTPWPLVRERTIPTDRPPLVDEI
jgi:hypothetical protein